MKTRFAVLLAGLLLLGAVAASAEVVSSSDVVPSPEAFIASLACTAAPAADAAMSTAPGKAAADVAPARSNLVMTCGSCSTNPCKGAQYNITCVVGTKRGTCLSPLGNNCTDGTWQCQCWSGPLP
jgi:hypothetical protein